MLRILIVDDSPEKCEKVKAVIENTGHNSIIETSETSSDAMQKLLTVTIRWDILILDLNLPRRKGETENRRAGLILLNEIIRRDKINKPNYIIGLTAHEDIKKEVQDQFNKEGWVICTYNPKYTDWEETIKNKIDYIMNNKGSNELEKRKILFVASSPEDLGRLNSGIEQRIIDEALTLSTNRNAFDLISKPGAKLSTLTGELLKNEPEIVHFTGHGNSDCIAMEDDNGETHKVPAPALNKLFGTMKKINCVVLSACHSSDQAKAISTNNVYVVGMNDSVGVDAATAFSKGFYQAIGEDKNISESFVIGEVHYLSNCEKGDENIPELWYEGKKIN